MNIKTVATVGRIKALMQRTDDKIFEAFCKGYADDMSFADIKYIAKQLNEAANAATELLASRAG